VDYSEERFRILKEEFLVLADGSASGMCSAFHVAPLAGDNVVERSERTP